MLQNLDNKKNKFSKITSLSNKIGHFLFSWNSLLIKLLGARAHVLGFDRRPPVESCDFSRHAHKTDVRTNGSDFYSLNNVLIERGTNIVLKEVLLAVQIVITFCIVFCDTIFLNLVQESHNNFDA